MKPKFTDLHRYPRGYTRSGSTDVAKTWAAARKKLQADAEERAQKVQPMMRKKATA